MRVDRHWTKVSPKPISLRAICNFMGNNPNRRKRKRRNNNYDSAKDWKPSHQPRLGQDQAP
jgi:hypothetical protein